MKQQISLKLLPSEAVDEAIIKEYLASATSKKASSITGYTTLKKSIDARGKQVYCNLTVEAFIDEPFVEHKPHTIQFGDVGQSKHSVIIVGAGPAGLFAALKLIENEIRPIVIERGKDVKSRRRDLAVLNKDGIIHPDSNYCFGEGGAGTYSDGKLYTRSNKRGNINRILNLFVQFGADKKILYESHPHIGTNKLPNIISAMRQLIIDCGGSVLFDSKVIDFIVNDGTMKGVILANGNSIAADSVLLATGHSARDIFKLLFNKKILLESKPFALGVRIEHPQNIIDSIQYRDPITQSGKGRNEWLPPASYSLVEQVQGKGVFSFCMCPGGIIATASTNAKELVVNGWSPSKRNNPFANSGMVVSVEENDLKNDVGFKEYLNKEYVNQEGNFKSANNIIHSPLSMMYFQEMVERKAFLQGGGKFVAPAQRLVDFCTNKMSADLPECSYIPGLATANLKHTLPLFIFQRLQQGCIAFGKKMNGYYTNQAVVVATESRTSSPVRIPRNSDTLQHPQIAGFFPCGEGAGYAGGIVSAAMDGERVAEAIACQLKSK